MYESGGYVNDYVNDCMKLTSFFLKCHDGFVAKK